MLFGLDLGPWHIPTFLFFVSIAVIVGSLIMIYEGRKKDINVYDLVGCVFCGFVGVFIGARIFSLLFWFDFGVISGFFDPQISAYSSFGGVSGGMLFTYIYCVYRKLSIWKFWDVTAVAFGLGLAIGRVACYLIPDDYGIITKVRWGVNFIGDGLRHPTQIYDMVNALFVFGLGLRFRKIKLFGGSIALVVFGVYSIIRFFIEFFRADKLIGVFTVNHITFGLLFLFCVGVFWWKWKNIKT